TTQDASAVDGYKKLDPTKLALKKSDTEAIVVNEEALAGGIGKNRAAINMMWTLITGFLVMFMQAGFALVETGLTRAKNVAHTMAMNVFIYPAGVVGFFISGFAIMFGGMGALGTLGGFDGLNHEVTVTL